MEMIDVLTKLREIAETKPELVKDALENVEKTNPKTVTEGGMKDFLHDEAEKMSRKEFIAKHGESLAGFWDSINGTEEAVEGKLPAGLQAYQDKKAGKEDKDVPAGSHKMPDGTIMKDSEHKKEVKEADDGDKRKGDPCWKGYKMVGMKNKGGQEVPNCVPMSNEELEEAGIELSEVKKMAESCGDCGLGDDKCKCEKENKESTMTGKKETEIDTEPKISYNK